MVASRSSRFWTAAIIALILVAIAGGAVAIARQTPGGPVEIMIPPSIPSPIDDGPDRQIVVEGAVINPGVYPLRAGDRIDTLIQAAGGAREDADLTRTRLHIPVSNETAPSQKVDLNRADVWLLKSLDGIGDTLAQRIVDYRQQNGPFANTRQVMSVKGISAAIYEKIKDRITVAD